jgi:CheY-like chemotaxis protein
VTSDGPGSKPESSGLPSDSQLEKSRILVVDDREENLIALDSLLSPLGHEVVLARSGEEALKQAFRRTFAVIVLDVRMPMLNGFETATILRNRETYRDTPIVFTSAHDVEVADLLGSYVAGATDFVEGPGHDDLLKFKVDSFVAMHRKNEAARKSAQEVAAAFEFLKKETRQSEPVMKGILLLERALLNLEQDLSKRIAR